MLPVTYNAANFTPQPVYNLDELSPFERFQLETYGDIVGSWIDSPTSIPEGDAARVFESDHHGFKDFEAWSNAQAELQIMEGAL